ncbi:MAG: TldD/PmbA family protein, partial [Actinomycetota bacterium]
MSLIDVEIALEAARAALRTGGFYADVICQRRATTTLRYEDGRVDDVSTGVDSGAGVRVIKGSLAAYAHTDVIDRDHLMRAADAAADALRHAAEGPALVQVETDRPVPPEVCEAGTGDYEITDVVSRLEQCDSAARSSGPEVRQVTGLHTSLVEQELLADSLGETTERGCERTRLVVQVVAGRDGVMQVGLEAPGELLGPGFYRSHDPAEIARKAAKRAIVMLDARPSPTGPMVVVVHSGTGGTMLHEACGHGLEADHLQRGASVYAGRVGEKVASSLVTALDNPTLPGMWGSYERDDEGTPSQPTVLIEEGVLRGFLYARHEAMKDGVASTGNGRRQSFRSLPIPRMSNTYIAPGSSQATEIISSTPSGLF